MTPMLAVLLVSLLVGQAQRPSSPANIGIRDATPASTVSSGEDAYITWTVPPTTTGMSYDISLDDGPWAPVAPADLAVIPLSEAEAATFRMYAVNRGKLALGQHTVRVRECDAARTTCAPSPVSTVTVAPPVSCLMGEWGPWTDWSAVWIPEGAVDRKYRYRYRAMTRAPGVGALDCPPGVETQIDSRPHAIPPAPTLDPITVSYVRMDSTTKGAWRGVYGDQGQTFAGFTTPALPFVTVTPVRASVWTWTQSTSDARGLQKPAPADPVDRFASTWYAADTFELDVQFSDALVHQVALYAVDWEATDRAQRLEVTDSQGTVRHAIVTGPELKAGAYYVWLISGHAKIRVTRTAGVNGVVFALLFGAAPGAAAQ